MPRPRRNDPHGVSDNPVAVTDPTREGELGREFVRRLAMIERNYSGLQRIYGDSVDFNRALDHLKMTVAGKGKNNAGRRRLHPELEFVVSELAKKNAAERTGLAEAKVVQEDIEAAAVEAAATLKPRAGARHDGILRYHVEALMALLQETTGKPVRASRYRASDGDRIYAPHIVGIARDIMLPFFQKLDPAVNETKLVRFIEEARAKYAGREMAFMDFFPMYGGAMHPETAMPRAGPGYRIEFHANIPIYSR